MLNRPRRLLCLRSQDFARHVIGQHGALRLNRPDGFAGVEQIESGVDLLVRHVVGDVGIDVTLNSTVRLSGVLANSCTSRWVRRLPQTGSARRS